MSTSEEIRTLRDRIADLEIVDWEVTSGLRESGIGFALVAGDLVAGIESLFGTQFLSSDIYPVNYLPSEIRAADVVLKERLYPRALLTPFTDDVELTPADRRAYQSYAQARRHKGFEQVEVSFGKKRRGRPSRR